MSLKRRLNLASLVVLSISLSACGGGGATTPTPTATPPATPSPTPSQSPAFGAPVAVPMFDPTRLHEAALEMEPADWQSLRENFLTNQYYAADLTIDGETVRQVGIRSRGAGSRNEVKPGLKVDFNKYVKGQEFYGYKTLIIDNQFQDSTLLRERLSFLVFEAMGIPAPRLSHTRLTVNGEYWGVYTLTEPISKPFLKARLGEESGNLFDYEYQSAYYFQFLGTEPTLYTPLPFEPETNEDKLDSSGLIAFIRATNELSDADFTAQMGNYLDISTFLTYVATENAVSEFDGFAGQFGMNNFYLYQYGDKNRFIFLPWDKDSSFAGATWPLYHRLDENVLTRRLTAIPAHRTYYVEAVKRAVNSYVNSAYLGAKLTEAYDQIHSAALQDTKKPKTNEEFELAVTSLRDVIATRQSDVLNQAP